MRFLPNNPCDWGDYFPPYNPWFPPQFPAQPAPQNAHFPPPLPADPTPSIPAQPVPPPPSSIPQSNPQKGFSYANASDAGYPWPVPTLNRQNYPTPGMFFDANNPDGTFVFQSMDQLIRAVLGSALSMAGADTRLATSNTEIGRSLRQQMSTLIQCSKYNDGLFGSVNTPSTGPHGRGIDWSARHADIFNLLSQGQVPFRTIDLEGRRLPNHTEANRLPFAWLPSVDLAALRRSQVIALSPEPPRTSEPDLSGVRLPGGVGCAPTSRPRRGSGDAQAFWAK